MQSDRCFNVNSQTVRQLVIATVSHFSQCTLQSTLDTVKPVRDLQLRPDPVGQSVQLCNSLVSLVPTCRQELATKPRNGPECGWKHNSIQGRGEEFTMSS